jgi:TPR repeat protein
VLRTACDAGGDRACVNLAAIYHDAELVPRDLPRALELLEKACGRGDDAGCGVLAQIRGP